MIKLYAIMARTWDGEYSIVVEKSKQGCENIIRQWKCSEDFQAQSVIATEYDKYSDAKTLEGALKEAAVSCNENFNLNDLHEILPNK